MPPAPYLSTGWDKTGNEAIWRWETAPLATLTFSPSSSDIRYFTAEVSALKNGEIIHPQAITLAINGNVAEKWTIDSTIVHDKLVVIPQGMIEKGTPVIVTLYATPSPHNKSPNIGLHLHSISLHINLDAYLAELQTGYSWACEIRNELLETIQRVLYFLANIDNPPPPLTIPLETILRDPYVVAKQEAPLRFDKHFFHANVTRLKEGHIHQAIRQWVADLKSLQDAVIIAGNYATSRPEIRCWSQDKLNEILPPPLKFTEKISVLRFKNTTLNNLEILLHKEQIDSVPPILYLDITNRCNFRCRMCYQSTSHFLRQNLINDHMAVILDMIPFLTQITVAGLGEPLLSKNLLSLAESANAQQCATTVITNGSLIANNIDILKHFSTVSISFDGSEATTFETLRHRSNFKQITNNIKKLRTEAPDISLAFSVVLSRANLDELSGIVQWASDLKINIINISPLEHMPTFELKKSDFPLFLTQLVKAQSIADQAGITLYVAISSQNFSKTNDTPRNKKALFDELSAMTPASTQNPRLESIAQGLRSVPFKYYPDPFVFSPTSCLQNSDQVTPIAHTAPPTSSLNFNIDVEIARLDKKIATCLTEIHALPNQSFSLPYCLDPWKLNYVKSNGKSRLCCHTDHIVGDLGTLGYRNAICSPKYQHVRQSMKGLQPMLTFCRQCRATDRTLGIESIKDTCRAYGIPVPTTINIQGSNNGGQ